MKHCRGFASVAKDFEKSVSKDVKNAKFNWVIGFTKRKDGFFAARVVVSADGFNNKSFCVFAKSDKSWETV